LTWCGFRLRKAESTNFTFIVRLSVKKLRNANILQERMESVIAKTPEVGAKIFVPVWVPTAPLRIRDGGGFDPVDEGLRRLPGGPIRPMNWVMIIETWY
jgi:hypothetical protein